MRHEGARERQEVGIGYNLSYLHKAPGAPSALGLQVGAGRLVDRGAMEVSDFFVMMFWIVLFGVLLLYCDKMNK